jgi:hypothetical protein
MLQKDLKQLILDLHIEYKNYEVQCMYEMFIY